MSARPGLDQVLRMIVVFKIWINLAQNQDSSSSTQLKRAGSSMTICDLFPFCHCLYNYLSPVSPVWFCTASVIVGVISATASQQTWKQTTPSSFNPSLQLPLRKLSSAARAAGRSVTSYTACEDVWWTVFLLACHGDSTKQTDSWLHFLFCVFISFSSSTFLFGSALIGLVEKTSRARSLSLCNASAKWKALDGCLAANKTHLDLAGWERGMETRTCHSYNTHTTPYVLCAVLYAE